MDIDNTTDDKTTKIINSFNHTPTYLIKRSQYVVLDLATNDLSDEILDNALFARNCGYNRVFNV